jgi:DNA-binding NarL/FixJ family response regulator
MSRLLVLVVSDNQTEVRVLSEILREQSRGEVSVVGAAGRGEDALSRAMALRPHVILVNLDPAEEGDLEILPRLRGLFVDVGIVALIAAENGGLDEAARAAGADHAVVRSQVRSHLASAVRQAAQKARARQRVIDQSAMDLTP